MQGSQLSLCHKELAVFLRVRRAVSLRHKIAGVAILGTVLDMEVEKPALTEPVPAPVLVVTIIQGCRSEN